MVLNGPCALPTALGCPTPPWLLQLLHSWAQGIKPSATHSFCRFSVNKRIFVVGFGLYGSIHGPTDYQVNIQVSCLPSGHAHSWPYAPQQPLHSVSSDPLSRRVSSP